MGVALMGDITQKHEEVRGKLCEVGSFSPTVTWVLRPELKSPGLWSGRLDSPSCLASPITCSFFSFQSMSSRISHIIWVSYVFYCCAAVSEPLLYLSNLSGLSTVTLAQSPVPSLPACHLSSLKTSKPSNLICTHRPSLSSSDTAFIVTHSQAKTNPSSHGCLPKVQLLN